MTRFLKKVRIVQRQARLFLARAAANKRWLIHQVLAMLMMTETSLTRHFFVVYFKSFSCCLHIFPVSENRKTRAAARVRKRQRRQGSANTK
jgi:hypothetical protein